MNEMKQGGSTALSDEFSKYHQNERQATPLYLAEVSQPEQTPIKNFELTRYGELDFVVPPEIVLMDLTS